jgi:amino acid adenylation domain-containing protein
MEHGAEIVLDKVAPTVATPLSFAQQRLWVLDRLHPNCAQNISAGIRLTGSLDIDALEKALSQVSSRHEILRSAFCMEGGEPKQLVLPRAGIPLKVMDLSGNPQSQREINAARSSTEESEKPFALGQGPLVRALLVRLASTEFILLITAHHIVCDQRSAEILLDEVAVFYDAVIRGESFPPSQPPQYRDFATGQRDAFSKNLAPQLAHYKKLLSRAVDNLNLPTDRPRPPIQSFRGASREMVIELPMVERLEELSKSQNVTLFVTLLSAFTVLLSRYSRQDDIVIGSSVSGNDLPGITTLIGPMENTLVISTDTSGDPSFLELLHRVSDSRSEIYAHRNVPFELLVEELHVERDMSRNPLFQIMFNLEEDLGNNDRRMHRLTTRPFRVQTGLERFDLSVRLLATLDGLELTFGYNTDLFDPQTIDRMLGHFRVLLESVADHPEQKISVLPLLTEAERQQLLVEWNDTSVGYPRNIPLHQFIEEQVERTPAAPALIYESEQLSYRELNSRANQLAHRLKKLGVGPDVLVAICAERSVEMVVALLGILKAGGAYVPLDPEYPRERLQTMQQEANFPVLLTQEHLLDRIPEGANHVICLDRDWRTIQEESPHNLRVLVSGKNLAYAIYTSGSTGKPKGVPNVHEGIVNRLLWMQDTYKLTAADRVLQKTPFSFDVSVWEFFWPLMAGATLVTARPDGHKDPQYLVNLITDQKITTLHFVPSMLSIFLEVGSVERCRTLTRVFVSGEALPFELQERFFERLPSELHNLYGPTEAAVDVTYWVCQPESKLQIVPIGRPIANIQIYILDASLQPVPIGVSGELHIGGIGLARGYLNRPDLTAQKFIPSPFDRRPGARLYKTGDLARFLPDGNIEYLGRIDHQVKLRGFRIELGEIEAVLTEYAGVRQAAVIVREDIPGDKRLVAYLVPVAGESLQVERVRDGLKKKLPEFMVPSKFVTLDNFPMTTSGKIDRRALPVPESESQDAALVLAPRDALETDLASIFQSILGVGSVGITDDFFELGGHSLLAARLISRVGAMVGFEIPLSALFQSPTVQSLARLLREGSVGGPDPVAMQIQAGHGGLPFFAIVPPAEEALGYAILARYMGRHQAVYKIQAHAPVVKNRPYTEQEMRAMSREYVAAILAVQSEGPYCLGGMCDGTHIAERITLDLEAQNREVGLLAIFDTWPLQNTQKPWLWLLYHYQQRIKQMRGCDLAEQIEICTRAAANRIRKLTGKVQVGNEWSQVYWPKDFVPERFRAPVALFKRPKQPFYYINDPRMGWGARSQGGVEIHQIPFDHDELLREPHVRTLGKELAACIERISQRSPIPSQHKERSGLSRPVTSGGRAG